MDVQSVISRAVVTAEGRFAPGHLGELTRLVPFEMVDAALEQTCRVQRRVRDLPSRVVVYLLLGACLFPELRYPGVWRKLTAGLSWLPGRAPSAGALAQARRRVGPEPLRFLFDLLRGPAAVPAAGVPGGTDCWSARLMGPRAQRRPDTPANLTRFSKQGGNHGGARDPQVRLLALVACGTRTVMMPVFGPTAKGETTYAAGLVRSLAENMIVLADRNFASGKLAAQVAGARAEFLIRARTGNGAPGLPAHRAAAATARTDPASAASRSGSSTPSIMVTTANGRRTGLLPAGHQPARRHPAPGQQPGRHLPRALGNRDRLTSSSNPPSSAAGSCGPAPPPGTGPGNLRPAGGLPGPANRHRGRGRHRPGHRSGPPARASPSPGKPPATSVPVSAAGILTADPADLAGIIGRHALATPLPGRRSRISPRLVKRAISKYQARATTDRTSGKATLTTPILNQPQTLTTSISP